MRSGLFQRLRPRSIYDVCAALALFVALGGTAYAVNTVNSTDIVDGQVKSVDVGDNEIKSADVKDQSLTTFDVSTFLGADIVDGTLTDADVGTYSEEQFRETVPALSAGECTFIPLGSTDYRSNHILLTHVKNPLGGEPTNFTYEVVAPSTLEQPDAYAQIKACNQSNTNQDTFFAFFSILVIKGS